jgi:putative glutamine amidotransferase
MDHYMQPAPVIGLPARMDPGTDRQYLSRNYTDAVSASGAVPLIIPLLEDPAILRAVLGRVDGILLTGSDSDIDPNHYGAEREAECGPVQPLRDATDYALLETAWTRKIPVLATCFGIQSLNVFLGGTLIQDIPSRIGNAVRHSDPGPPTHFSHTIEISRGSILQDLADSLEPPVNSTHHQAIDRIGRGLQVIARAPDGIIEAVAGPAEGHWILGVQWHPEKSFAYDAFSQNIFAAFVARCRTEREIHPGTHPEAARGDRGGS